MDLIIAKVVDIDPYYNNMYCLYAVVETIQGWKNISPSPIKTIGEFLRKNIMSNINKMVLDNIMSNIDDSTQSI